MTTSLPSVPETTKLMATFPDDESVARLRELRVRFVLIHQAFYKPADFALLMDGISRRAELVPVA